MIEVKNLVKKYGDHLAVDHLNFTVEKGKIYGFLGPNGAGKSTTMNMITGYLASTKGEISVNGHNILKEPDLAKRSIGYLPEQPPVYFDMTVLEYLQFAAELKKIPKDRRKEEIDEVMDLVKIQDVSGRLIKNLSKGYRQRVGLAQAILGYPEVIILDEPTVGLDPKQIIEIRDLIKSLKEKHTVILSSHILSEVSAVCDYILILSHGKLAASGTPEQLEELARGSDTLELVVRGDQNTVERAVREIKNLNSCRFEKWEKEKDAVKVVIETQEGMDIREEVFYKMAEVRCPILQMQMNRISLESIFLELTEDSQQLEEKDEKEEKERQNTEELPEYEEGEEQVEEEENEDAGDL